MKISYNWLRQYIDIELTPEQLSSLLTDIGLEVEALEEVASVKGGLEGIIIGEVEEKQKHPDADKLSLTKVNIGAPELLDIVCGAPNVEAGQKVLVATVGTKIYMKDGDFVIKKAKIRGAASEGMICAEDELGLGDAHDGIMVLPQDAPIGMPAKDYFKIEKDRVFEIGLTPNRADAASHLGVARDLLAALKNRNVLPEDARKNIKLNFEKNTATESNNSFSIDVDIEDVEACRRYSGLTMQNIKVGDSPEWLKNKLKAIGLKSINNIVDISNYILFSLGQPLHIFDADKIKGHKVLIKKYDAAFDFITLDGITQKMTTTDLMICNEEEPMCIAGIYGGLNSGVTTETKNIFIESAYFEPVGIRKTSKRLGLKTDSSFRFERGTDPDMTVPALIQAAQMVSELAGGVATSAVVDVYPKKIEAFKIAFRYDYFYKIAGKVIDKETIKNILTDLEIVIAKEEPDVLHLQVPPYRVDVTREIDVVEEVLRIYGFNSIDIPDKLQTSLSYSPKPDREKILDTIAGFMSSRGYNEIMNNSLSKLDYYEKLNYFDKEKSVRILNPLSKDLEILRQTLLYSALEVVSYNINRATSDMQLFELGKFYQKDSSETGLEKYKEGYVLSIVITGKQENETWRKHEDKHDFFSLKADVLSMLNRMGIKTEKLQQEEQVPTFYRYGLSLDYKKKTLVKMGMLDKNLLKYFDIKQEVFYAELDVDFLIQLISEASFGYKEPSKFPKMRRDLALLLHENITFSRIEELARQQNFATLKEIGLFDIYQGDNIEKGKKSYAVSFIFQDDTRTLTDDEVDGMMKKMMKIYEKELNAIIR